MILYIKDASVPTFDEETSMQNVLNAMLANKITLETYARSQLGLITFSD